MEITLERFNEVIEGLEKGQIRVAEKIDGQRSEERRVGKEC